MNAADTVRTYRHDSLTFRFAPMDHGGYVISYLCSHGDELYLTATDRIWIGGDAIDWNSDAGEDEVRWHDLAAAKARIRQLNRM